MRRRLPIRVRLTLATAAVVSLVLAGLGLFLYLRLDAHLSAALDRDLHVRSQDLAALVREGGSLPQTARGRLIERGESYAQLLAPDGRPLQATWQLRRRPLLTRQQVAAALQHPLSLEKDAVPGLDEPSRLLATGVTRGDRRAVLVVGETLQDTTDTLSSFRDELLLSIPVTLVLACGLGWIVAGLWLREVEAMRRRERAFLADAGHELRTPLALLRTELELALRQAESGEELRAAVARSSQEVARLSQLAEDLLLLARSEDGRLALRAEPLDVDDVFAAVLARYEWRAAQSGKRLSAAPAGTALLSADRLRVEQALGNLVDNALRFGGGEVRLEAIVRNGGVQLHVRDSGAGFPDGFCDRAFERFARADAARGAGGAGLGLAIVRTIAEAHGGAASARNVVGGGADVWLSLPAG